MRIKVCTIRVRARRLYENSYEFTPTHKIFFAANDRPEVRGTDQGIWSRLKLIPFEVVIPEGERDTKLSEKLMSEAEGILAWMVRGCLVWQAEGLRTPAVVSRATSDYRRESDPVGEFLQACCDREVGSECTTDSLFTAYEEWRKLAGHGPLSKVNFSRRLTGHGIEVSESLYGKNRQAMRRGCKLQLDWKKQFVAEAAAS